MARRSAATPYVSPFRVATDIVARLRDPQARVGCPLSQRQYSLAYRIVRLPVHVRDDLELEEAPWRVWRWVAWAGRRDRVDRRAAERARADLVIHLRRSIDTRHGGWPSDVALDATWCVWAAEIEMARKQGFAQPRAGDVPRERYERAMATGRSPSSPKRASPRRVEREAPPPQVLSEEQRALLAQAMPALRALEAVLPAIQGLIR